MKINSTEKRKQIEKYFRPFPKYAVWVILIGVPMVMAGGVGVLMIIGGGVIIYLHYQRPTDDQIDDWLEGDIAGLAKKGLTFVGLEREQLVRDELIVFGPYLSSTRKVEVQWKRGKDGRSRFVHYNVCIIYFTEHHLSYYKCLWDCVRGMPLGEEHDEYFYGDVVAARVTSVPDKITHARTGEVISLESVKMFQLTTSGGVGVSVSINSEEQFGDVFSSDVDGAIRSVREMLRVKKGKGT